MGMGLIGLGIAAAMDVISKMRISVEKPGCAMVGETCREKTSLSPE